MQKIRVNKARGFSLLEIILVLAIIGLILTAAATYTKNIIDKYTWQGEADAIAQEIYGIVQFVNMSSITASVKNKGAIKPGAIQNITNPLYQQSDVPVSDSGKLTGMRNNPIWLAHSHSDSSLNVDKATVSPYIARVYSKSLSNPIENKMIVSEIERGVTSTYYSHSLKWSQAEWGKSSIRSYFTDSGCPSVPSSGGVSVYFNQPFFSCDENPTLKKSEIGISRVDFVNSKGTVSRTTMKVASVSIDRVDVYISFNPKDGNPARIQQFITPLMSAFRTKKINPNTNGVYLVRRINSNSWSLLNKTNGNDAATGIIADKLATFSDIPDMVDKFKRNQIYGLRFSFDGNGEYLRSDGLNAAKKVCWNTTTGTAGPCLTSPSQDSLVLTQRNASGKQANLQVGEVILKTGLGTKAVYNTTPRIKYETFNNKGNLQPIYRLETDSKVLCNKDGCEGVMPPSTPQVEAIENGAISIPLQTCPTAEGFTRSSPVGLEHTLYPRLSVAISSVVSGLVKKTGTDGTDTPIFKLTDPKQYSALKTQGKTLQNFIDGDISINRLGGVILQVSKKTADWRISSFVGIEDSKSSGHNWQYYNPPWLSVVVTTWCSSEPQND